MPPVRLEPTTTQSLSQDPAHSSLKLADLDLHRFQKGDILCFSRTRLSQQPQVLIEWSGALEWSVF